MKEGNDKAFKVLPYSEASSLIKKVYLQLLDNLSKNKKSKRQVTRLSIADDMLSALPMLLIEESEGNLYET